MNLIQVRDQLIAKQANSRRAREQAEATVAQLKEAAKNISDSDFELCTKYGIDLSAFAEINYDRLITDAEYLERTRALLSTISECMMAKIEEVLACTE